MWGAPHGAARPSLRAWDPMTSQLAATVAAPVTLVTVPLITVPLVTVTLVTVTVIVGGLVAVTLMIVGLVVLGKRRRRRAAPAAALEPADGGEPVPLARRRLAVGRHHADLTIREPTVSAVHAELVRQGDRWAVHDRRSRNGTFVNDERVEESRTLHDGDRIRFATDGPTYVFRSGPVPPPSQRGRSA